MSSKLGLQLKPGSGSAAEEGFGSTRSQVRILSPRLTFQGLAKDSGLDRGWTAAALLGLGQGCSGLDNPMQFVLKLLGVE